MMHSTTMFSGRTFQWGSIMARDFGIFGRHPHQTTFSHFRQLPHHNLRSKQTRRWISTDQSGGGWFSKFWNMIKLHNLLWASIRLLSCLQHTKTQWYTVCSYMIYVYYAIFKKIHFYNTVPCCFFKEVMPRTFAQGWIYIFSASKGLVDLSDPPANVR